MKFLVSFYLTLLFICTFLGYWIAPDNTHFAAQQIPELAQKKPLSFAYLAIAKKNPSSFFHTFWYGKNPSEIWVLHEKNPFSVISPDTIELHLLDNQVKKMKIQELEALPQRFIFYLGTDPLGRDIFSRLIIGTRYSVGIAMISIAISIVLGIFLGLFAGYQGGIWDLVISGWMNIFWALPSSLLAIGIAYAIGKGFWTLVVAISSVLWIDIARIVRLETIRLKELNFIKATKVLALSNLRIILFHILPNLRTPILVVSFSTFTTALILEGSLSFLGLGVTPPAPSWGTLLFDGFYYVALSSGKWLLFAPAFCLISTVLCIQHLTTLLQK